MIQKISLVGAAALAIAASAVSAQNLVTNGGFEAGNTSGWLSFPTSNSTFGVTNDANTGSFAGQLVNNQSTSAAVVKQISLGAGFINIGDSVLVTFAAKGSGAIGGVAFAEFFTEISGGGISSSRILSGAPLNLTSSYQPFSFLVPITVNSSGGVTLQFAAVTGADVGSVSSLTIDDVSVSVVPAPASAGLLALGGLLAVRRRR